MRAAQFSAFADRPVRLEVGIFGGSSTLRIIEQPEFSVCAPVNVASIFDAGDASKLQRAVAAFNAVMDEADAPLRTVPIVAEIREASDAA